MLWRVFIVVWILVAGGCASIVGIEEQTFDGGDGDDGRDGSEPADGHETRADAKVPPHREAGSNRSPDARFTEEALDTGDSAADEPASGDDAAAEGGGDEKALPDGSPSEAGFDAQPDTSTKQDAAVAPAASADAASDHETRDAPTGTDGACSSIMENCTNGIDDNCDGKIDCADPECMSQGFTCVPPWASSGWTGPAVLYDAFQAGGPAPTPLSCASAGAYTQALPTAASTRLGNYDPTAEDPTCGCTCGSTVQGVTCPEPSVTGSTNSCPGGGTTVTATATTTCSQLTASDAVNSFTVTQGAASGGTCPSNETGLPVPAWNTATGWEGTGSACTTGRAASSYFSGAQGGCTGTEVCVEPLPGAFNGGAACVFLSGKATCPTGYSTEHDYFTGANDTRSCEYTCTCTPTGVACTADLTVSNQSTCTGGMTMTDLSIGCTSVSDYSPVWMEATVASTGSCTFAAGAVAGGAAATGSVTPTGQVTVCCDK
jgi:hypothetical protein